MDTHYSRIIGFAGTLVVAGLLWAGTAGAQGQSMPNATVHEESCSDVNWSSQLLAAYPRIPEACQEVLTMDGKKWARFNGKLISWNANGSVTADVMNREGKALGRLTLKPAVGQKVVIDGKEKAFSQLNTGAVLNLYIPEEVFAVATEPGEPESEMSEIETYSSEDMDVAANEPEELPATAGPLPWVLTAGIGMLLIGFGVMFGRRLIKR